MGALVNGVQTCAFPIPASRVTLDVQERTPVRADSVATMEREGLTGGRYVLLSGGSPSAPPLEPPPGRDRAEIPPGYSTFEQVLEDAPEVLENVNVLLLRDRKSTRLNSSH